MRYRTRVAVFFGVFFVFIFLYTLDSLHLSRASNPNYNHTHSEEFAYVFYATDNVYACSAMINVHRLKNLFKTRHPIYLLASKGVSGPYKAAFRERYGVRVIEHEPPPVPGGFSRYYRDVMLKLVSFSLHRWAPDVRRIIVLDADQLLLRSLDELFIRVPEDVEMTAARAYWVPEELVATTAMMMVSLSERLWARVESALVNLASDTYDMDLINTEFAGEMLLLPDKFLALNSHWETGVVPAWSDHTVLVDPLTSIFAEDVYVLHFTALGKPWSFTVKNVRKLRPEAHPLFAEQFFLWRTAAKHVCPALRAEEKNALDVVGKKYFYGAPDLDRTMVVDQGSRISEHFLDEI